MSFGSNNNNNNGGSRGRQTRTDIYGNATQLIGCKPNKKGFPVGYVEIGGQLYKLEPSTSNKEGVSAWIKVTKMQKRQQQRGF